jgi:hypothetical protein
VQRSAAPAPERYKKTICVGATGSSILVLSLTA